MPYDFHSDTKAYLDLLIRNSEKSIVPFIEKHLSSAKTIKGLRILELGCGEGGNLKPFAERGAICTGFDLNGEKIKQGNLLMATHIAEGTLELFHDNIFNDALSARFKGKFDLIILKDVIEHIPDKAQAMRNMSEFLNEDGLFFVGWPPWAMPFGGHQQICHSGLLKKLPWFHLLPKPLYVALLKAFKEPEEVWKELAEVHDYQVPIGMMHRLIKEAGLKKVGEVYYLINPIYEDKFGFKTRLQFDLVKATPGLRDLFTTSVYYLLKKI